MIESSIEFTPYDLTQISSYLVVMAATERPRISPP